MPIGCWRLVGGADECVGVAMSVRVCENGWGGGGGEFIWPGRERRRRADVECREEGSGNAWNSVSMLPMM